MSTLVEAVARLLLAPALVVAAALLVKGSSDVGDGFSAGVVVTLALALQYLALGPERAEEELPVLRQADRVAVAGLLLALATAFAPLAFGEPPFTHLPGPDAAAVRFGTLEVSTLLLFDVAVFLLVVGALASLLHDLARPHTAGEPGERAP